MYGVEVTEGRSGLATSGVEGDAMRLLGAFYDLSGGRLNEPVPVAGSGGSVGAARSAGLEPGTPESDIAVRYLVNGGYIEGAQAGAEAGAEEGAGAVEAYKMTVAGFDRARELRGLGGGSASPERSSGMSEKTQRRLLTVLGIVLSQILARPLMRFVSEQIPERRGTRDDVLEAVIKGGTRAVALLVASLIIKQVAARR